MSDPTDRSGQRENHERGLPGQGIGIRQSGQREIDIRWLSGQIFRRNPNREEHARKLDVAHDRNRARIAFRIKRVTEGGKRLAPSQPLAHRLIGAVLAGGVEQGGKRARRAAVQRAGQGRKTCQQASRQRSARRGGDADRKGRGVEFMVGQKDKCFRKISCAFGLRQALARRVCTGKSERAVTVPSEASRSLPNSNSASDFRTADERPRDGGSIAARSDTADKSRPIGVPVCADFATAGSACARMAEVCQRSAATSSRVALSASCTASRPRHQSRPVATVEIPDGRTGSPQPIACVATVSAGRRPGRRSAKRATSLPL
jgi:hypothetical protein